MNPHIFKYYFDVTQPRINLLVICITKYPYKNRSSVLKFYTKGQTNYCQTQAIFSRAYILNESCMTFCYKFNGNVWITNTEDFATSTFKINNTIVTNKLIYVIIRIIHEEGLQR